MKCRYCGMESRTTPLCEWCKKPLTGVQQQGQSANAPPLQPPGGPQPGQPLNAPPLAQPLGGSPSAQPLTGVQSIDPLVADRTQPVALPNRQAGAPLLNDLTQPMPSAAVTPLTAAPQPAPAQPAVMPRTTLSGEVITTPSAAAPTVYNAPSLSSSGPIDNRQSPIVNNMPPPGATIQGGPPPVYPSAYAVVSPGAVTPGRVSNVSESISPQASVGERFELFLAIAMPVLLGSILLVHAIPTLFFYVLIGDMFLLSMVMGATGAVPSYDDAVADVSIMLGIMFVVRIFLRFPFLGVAGILLGSFMAPVLALLVYGVIGLVRQEWNRAIVGLLTLNIVLEGALTYAMLTSSANSVQSILMFGFANWMKFFAALLGMAGWIVSSIFRPVEATD